MLYQKQEYIFEYEQNNTKISLTNTSEPAHTIGTKVPLKKKGKKMHDTKIRNFQFWLVITAQHSCNTMQCTDTAAHRAYKSSLICHFDFNSSRVCLRACPKCASFSWFVGFFCCWVVGCRRRLLFNVECLLNL